MASLSWSVLGLGLLLAAVARSGSSASHSVRYFYTSLSQPGQGLPQFIAVGYVDDQLIVKYDSDARRVVPQVPWMEKVVKDDPQYWEWNTQGARNAESVFRVDLETLRGRYNQSRGGLHTWQQMYGCEVGADGGFSGGQKQYAYDGEDFLAFDKETLTWTARVPQAWLTKNRWEDPEVQAAQRFNAYLEDLCALWLRRYLDYGRESLQRTEAPTVRMTRKAKDDGQETLIFHLYGFYPKGIDVTLRKEGVIQDQDTFHGGVVPNSDGTYNTWRSIDIDPKERGLYRCYVEHDSLEKPLDLPWEEPASASNLGLILGILGAILAVAIIVGVIIVLRQRRKGYKAASRSDQGSDNSTKVVVAEA